MYITDIFAILKNDYVQACILACSCLFNAFLSVPEKTLQINLDLVC